MVLLSPRDRSSMLPYVRLTTINGISSFHMMSYEVYFCEGRKYPSTTWEPLKME